MVLLGARLKARMLLVPLFAMMLFVPPASADTLTGEITLTQVLVGDNLDPLTRTTLTTLVTTPAGWFCGVFVNRYHAHDTYVYCDPPGMFGNQWACPTKSMDLTVTGVQTRVHGNAWCTFEFGAYAECVIGPATLAANSACANTNPNYAPSIAYAEVGCAADYTGTVAELKLHCVVTVTRT